MMRPGTMLAAMLVMLTAGATAHAKMEMCTFPVLAGARAHDVCPAPDGAVWFTASAGDTRPNWLAACTSCAREAAEYGTRQAVAIPLRPRGPRRTTVGS